MPPDLTELDELESGLTSGFWQRLNRHIEQEWGPAGETYQQAIRNSISGAVGSEVEAVHRLKNVAFAQQAIRQVLQWPVNRVATLKGQKQAAAMAEPQSRRGRGL